MIHKLIEEKLAASADPERGRYLLKNFEAAYQEVCSAEFDWGRPAAAYLISIFGNSLALSEKLIRFPAWADDLAGDPSWDRPKNCGDLETELKNITASIGPSDLAGWQRALRHFKYRHLIRIVARDLSVSPPVHEVLGEWSDVADVIIQEAYNVARQMGLAQFGEPMWRLAHGQMEPCAGLLLALGKLGSRELNLSSDIDLLCLYESDDGETTGGPRGRCSNHEFFTKVITSFTQLLAPVTEDGFVFRCDYDLRPEGPKGPLVNSISAAERYYEVFGRDWERQMLIRARPVAGDLPLGEAFIDYISPFVYRRSLTFRDLNHLKQMKEKIESQALTPEGSENIKLGRGGIRELEFLVQGLQQVFGGQLKSIRIPNTFDAIEALAGHHLIHPHGARVLRDSYAFLRRVENMVQIEHDRQTHELPAAAGGWQTLARRLGWHKEYGDKAPHALRAAWQRHSASVHRLFENLFEADYQRLELEEAVNANLATCVSDEEQADSLPWFKNQEIKRLARLDLEGKIPLALLLKQLSLVAEVVIRTAWQLAVTSLTKRFGAPRHEDGTAASFAVLGFGRLGSREMDYGSDLDLCFLYSGEGKTKGPEVITNQEFFTRLSQRIISLISINSRYGRAYLIDSELRPSGQQGSLVASLDSFTSYHRQKSQIWERLALLKARVIVSDEPFSQTAQSALAAVTYEAPLPEDESLRGEILRLRGRAQTEAAREKQGVYNLKIGRGGMADVEGIMQYLQLCQVPKQPALRVHNGFEIIAALQQLSVIDDKTYDLLFQSYYFYRLLMARLRLFTNSATDLIDFASPYIEALAQRLNFAGPAALQEKLESTREQTRGLFAELFGEENNQE